MQCSLTHVEGWVLILKSCISQATGVAVRNCELLAAGTSGVWMEHHVQHCAVENNWIQDVSFSGVHINGFDIGAYGPSLLPRYTMSCQPFRPIIRVSAFACPIMHTKISNIHGMRV